MVRPLAGRGARFMVLVDGRPASTELVRATCRLAAAEGGPWLAVYLDVSQRLFYSRAEERRLAANLRLVERLGGDLACCQPARGRLAQDLLALARARGVTHLVLCHVGPGTWLARYRGSLAEELVQGGLQLVIHVSPSRGAAPAPLTPPRTARAVEARQLGLVLALVAAATGLGFLVFRFLELADVMMVYMLAITVAATQFGRRATLVAMALSILALDFCFIEPRYTFVLTDIQHIGTFAVMAGVGWVVLVLAEHIRAQKLLAQDHEHHARTLYRVGSVLAEGGPESAIQARVEAFLGRELGLPAVILLCDEQGRLPVVEPRLDSEALACAREALARGVAAGQGTELAPQAPCLLLPMAGMERPVGVLALLPPEGSALPDPGRLDLLLPLAAQVSLALERAGLAEERTRARIRADHEELRSSLLSSVSHDLRSPLGTITGATTTLLDPGPEAAPGDQKILLNTIHQESRRLLRMVDNLLELTRLESGQVRVKKEWVAIEEVVGSAISHLEEPFATRPLAVDLPELWVPMDPVLFEQVLLNLLDNALKYSPPGTAIAIRGWEEDGTFCLQVADQGPGLAPGEEELVFGKLYRGAGGAAAPGSGLGLAICKGIVLAHGGAIQARTQGGAQFTLRLPLDAPGLAGLPSEPRPDPAP